MRCSRSAKQHPPFCALLLGRLYAQGLFPSDWERNGNPSQLRHLESCLLCIWEEMISSCHLCVITKISPWLIRKCVQQVSKTCVYPGWNCCYNSASSVERDEPILSNSGLCVNKVNFCKWQKSLSKTSCKLSHSLIGLRKNLKKKWYSVFDVFRRVLLLIWRIASTYVLCCLHLWAGNM